MKQLRKLSYRHYAEYVRISKSFVDKVDIPALSSTVASTQSFYRDTAIVGFGLRVTSEGTKSFIVEKRINSKVKKITFGRYGNLMVKQAKIEAIRILGKVATGLVPISKKKKRMFVSYPYLITSTII